MIFETHDRSGNALLINAKEIVTVEEPGAAGHWHGIRCYIKLTSGRTIECGEDVRTISKKIAPPSEVDA